MHFHNKVQINRSLHITGQVIHCDESMLLYVVPLNWGKHVIVIHVIYWRLELETKVHIKVCLFLVESGYYSFHI